MASVLLFFLLSVPPTALAVLSPRAALALTALGLAGVRHRPLHGASFLSWLNAVKLASLLVAAGVACAAQLGVGVPPALVHGVLAVNMLEAVVTDVCIGSALNAVAGLALVYQLETPAVAARDGVVLCAVPLRWVLLYTTWNAAFAHGVGFSRGACLVLLTPFVVCALVGEFDAWTAARTYSLLFLQLMRGSEFTRVFTPGATWVTKAEGAPSVNYTLRLAWGLLNAMLCCIM